MKLNKTINDLKKDNHALTNNQENLKKKIHKILEQNRLEYLQRERITY